MTLLSTGLDSVVLTSAFVLSSNVTLTFETLEVTKVSVDTAAVWSMSRSTNSILGSVPVREIPVVLKTEAGVNVVGRTTIMAFVLLPSSIMVSAHGVGVGCVIGVVS